MQQDTENENTSKFRRYVWIGVSLLLLLGANYIYFKIKVSSNHDLASHYTLKGDPIVILQLPVCFIRQLPNN